MKKLALMLVVMFVVAASNTSTLAACDIQSRDYIILYNAEV